MVVTHQKEIDFYDWKRTQNHQSSYKIWQIRRKKHTNHRLQIMFHVAISQNWISKWTVDQLKWFRSHLHVGSCCLVAWPSHRSLAARSALSSQPRMPFQWQCPWSPSQAPGPWFVGDAWLTMKAGLGYPEVFFLEYSVSLHGPPVLKILTHCWPEIVSSIPSN